MSSHMGFSFRVGAVRCRGKAAFSKFGLSDCALMLLR